VKIVASFTSHYVGPETAV